MTLTMHPVRVVPLCSRYAPAVAFAVLPLMAQGAGLEDAFATMDKIAQQFRAVSTDIKRDVYTAVIDDHEKDMGTMKAKRDKHDTLIRIDFTSPAEKVLALDDTKAQVYTPKTKTIQELDVKKGVVDQFLLLGFGASSAEIKEHYEVTYLGTEKIGADGTWHLQLIPRSSDVLKYLKKAELWISQSSGLPMQEKLYTSTSGDYELVYYSNVKLNPSLPDSAVKLNPPKGVTISRPRL